MFQTYQHQVAIAVRNQCVRAFPKHRKINVFAMQNAYEFNSFFNALRIKNECVSAPFER